MPSRRIEIEIPGSMAGYMPVDDAHVKTRMEKLLLADLIGQGVISFGKAAELAGVDKMTFITDMGQMGIPYFNGTVSDVLKDAETVGQTAKGSAK